MDLSERSLNTSTIYVGQGEFAVSSDPVEVLSTVLGSCVAACLYDPFVKVGGMNHFLLPSVDGRLRDVDNLYGVHLMELLINALMKAGADKRALRARLFGGASLIGSTGEIGARNAAFAREFMVNEGIRLEEERLGGDYARRIRFAPVFGEVIEKPVPISEGPAQTPKPFRSSGGIEIFNSEIR